MERITGASVDPNANGEATIAHGLSSVPSFASVNIRGDHVNHADIKSVDATNLTVRIKDSTGADVTSASGSQKVYWEARI